MSVSISTNDLRSRVPPKEQTHERVHADDPEPGARLSDGHGGRVPVELRPRARGAAEPLREGRRGAVDLRAGPPLGSADRPREVLDDAARYGRADRPDIVLEV